MVTKANLVTITSVTKVTMMATLVSLVKKEDNDGTLEIKVVINVRGSNCKVSLIDQNWGALINHGKHLQDQCSLEHVGWMSSYSMRTDRLTDGRRETTKVNSRVWQFLGKCV